MAEVKISLTQEFLQQVQQQSLAVTVFLLNGVKLQGHILRSDETSLVLQRERMRQLVFLHAISTIMPNEPLELP